MLWRKKQAENPLRVVDCALCDEYGTDYVYILEGIPAIPVGSVVEMYIERRGTRETVGLLEIVDLSSAGQYQAIPVWMRRLAPEVLTPVQHKYPNVSIDPYVRRRSVDTYIKREGLPTLAHVLDTDALLYVVYRRIGEPQPWAVYELNKNSHQFAIISYLGSLPEVQKYLTGKAPECRTEIDGWGTAGARVFNVMDYGARGDGETDDSDAIERVYRHARVGDHVLFPYNKKFRITRRIWRVAGVHIDSTRNSFILDYKDESGE